MVPPKTPSTPPSVPWHRRRLTPALRLGTKGEERRGETTHPQGRRAPQPPIDASGGDLEPPPLLKQIYQGQPPGFLLLYYLIYLLLHNLLLPTQRTTRETSAGRFCDGLARDRGGRAGSYDPRGGYPAPALHKPRQAGSPTRSSRRTFSGLCLPRATTTWRRGPQRPVSVLVTALAGSSLRAPPPPLFLHSVRLSCTEGPVEVQSHTAQEKVSPPSTIPAGSSVDR